MPVPAITKHRFTVKEYHRLGETGVLPPDARVELLEGEIIDKLPLPARHRFTVTDFYRMGEEGLLPPDSRVELLEGQIIDMSPIGPIHSAILNELTDIFSRLPKGRCVLSVQNPLLLNDRSQPQPDLMLLSFGPKQYRTRHPTPDKVLLLIEVSDSTLPYDREVKAPAYGRAGVPEVWIVNVFERNIEIHRDPNLTGYGSVKIVHEGEKASPLAFPDVQVDVSELMKSN
jgi:Uma2 family endonuclease